MKSDLEQLRERLHDLADSWDQEAKDAHLDGLSDSARVLRQCRDDLRRVLRGRTAE